MLPCENVIGPHVTEGQRKDDNCPWKLGWTRGRDVDPTAYEATDKRDNDA